VPFLFLYINPDPSIAKINGVKFANNDLVNVLPLRTPVA
jgi:hypothetical protein